MYAAGRNHEQIGALWNEVPERVGVAALIACDVANDENDVANNENYVANDENYVANDENDVENDVAAV